MAYTRPSSGAHLGSSHASDWGHTSLIEKVGLPFLNTGCETCVQKFVVVHATEHAAIVPAHLCMQGEKQACVPTVRIPLLLSFLAKYDLHLFKLQQQPVAMLGTLSGTTSFFQLQLCSCPPANNGALEPALF
eukprot:scaffold208300_cov18-Tisochrysis_lutea.AAC.6